MYRKLLNGFASFFLALTISIAGFTPALAAPPVNDNFADAEIITSLPFTATVDLTEVTIEPNEPQPCYSMDRSIWYSFTPAVNMMISADTQGSTFYNTNVNVYHQVGTEISDLQFLTCSIFSTGTAVFQAEAGQTYYLEAGNAFGDVGTLQVNVQQLIPPANDNFSVAEEINSLPFNTTLNINGAGIEAIEPQSCNNMDKTVWYRFTPTENMSVRVNTQGTAIPNNVTIYHSTGPGDFDLQFLTCANNSGGVFLAEMGQTYYLQAGTFSGWFGDIQINVEQIFPPPNDEFNNAVTINELPYSDNLDTSNATSSFDDPTDCHNNGSVWYEYTPASDTTIVANTIGSNYDTTLGVFTGSPGALSLVPGGCNDDFYGVQSRVAFTATGGTTYYFMLGFCCGNGNNGGGNLVFSVEEILPPSNDNFATATPVGSLPSTIDFDTTAATFQSNEPSPSCAYPAPPYRTAWFSFTASQDGSVSASVPNSNFSSFVAVYSGTDFTNLTQLGCGQYSNKATFPAMSGQIYYIQIGGLYGSGGTGQFLLETTPPPVADFYYYPGDPSKFDTIQFQDNSHDPGNIGIQTHTWNFGDGTSASSPSPTHKYATDGDYEVTHTVTTIDGRTASIIQTVQVRTHDVAITKITVPTSANVEQTKTISVTLRNIAYSETVQVDLYKSTPNGFVWVATVTKSVPALKGNRTTAVDFSYKFLSEDTKLGKVNFKAVVTINGARDAYPSDNEVVSSITKVAK